MVVVVEVVFMHLDTRGDAACICRYLRHQVEKKASRVLMPKVSFARFLTASGKVFCRGECASRLRSLG